MSHYLGANFDMWNSSYNKIIGNSFHNVNLDMTSCNDNEIKDNTMEAWDPPCALDMLWSNNNKIVNNEMAGDMEIYFCEDNEIKGNNIHDGAGICLIGSNNNTIVENNITDHLIGIENYGQSNQIYYNNFINNRPYDAYDLGDNTWDDGSGKGNYWDNWSSKDSIVPIAGLADNEDPYLLDEELIRLASLFFLPVLIALVIVVYKKRIKKKS